MAQSRRNRGRTLTSQPSQLFKRILFLVVFVVLVTAAGLLLRTLPNWEWLLAHEQVLRRQVDQAPLASWCMGLMIYFLLSLIPGLTGKSVVIGWLFGFFAGLLMVEIGLTAAAILSFFIGHFAFGQFATSHWRRRLRVFRRRFSRDGLTYLLLLRLAHAPFSLVNYTAGATRVPLALFAWTTLLGILPGSAVFVFVGSRMPSLSVLAEQGVWALLDHRLFLALLASACLPYGVKLLVNRLSRRLHPAVHHGQSADASWEEACHR